MSITIAGPRRRTGKVLPAVGVALAGVLLPVPADAAGQGYFVVDTQFWNKASQIIDAGGPYVGCTSVKNLSGDAEQTGPQSLTFTGVKQLTCSDKTTVTIGYEATTSTGSPTNHGTWWTISATDPALAGLSGSLSGDYRSCTIAKASRGCVTDTFRVTGP